MPFFDIGNGVKINYEKKGEGNFPVVFIHGNLANAMWWEMTLENLPKEFTGYAIDLPGSGESPETGERHTIEYFANIVHAFVTEMRLERFHLVGHSMGGGVAQLYTIMHPDRVAKLVLVDSMAADGFHVLFDRGEETMRYLMGNKEALGVAIRAIAPGCKDEGFMERAIESAYKASKQVFIEQPVTMHEANWFDRLGEIKCPVLFVHGEDDVFVPKQGSERTAGAIPNCTFKYLKDSNHSPLVEIPFIFQQELFEFLKD